jgi:hypothetical protein
MCTETDASADGANFRWKQHVLALHDENYYIYTLGEGRAAPTLDFHEVPHDAAR